jgi:hypothetical protein
MQPSAPTRRRGNSTAPRVINALAGVQRADWFSLYGDGLVAAGEFLGGSGPERMAVGAAPAVKMPAAMP